MTEFLLSRRWLNEGILYYKSKSLCICLLVFTFSLAGELMNRLGHVKLATIAELVFCGAVSITSYVLSFKSYEFLRNELNDLAYASRHQNIRGHSSRDVTLRQICETERFETTGEGTKQGSEHQT